MTPGFAQIWLSAQLTQGCPAHLHGLSTMALLLEAVSSECPVGREDRCPPATTQHILGARNHWTATVPPAAMPPDFSRLSALVPDCRQVQSELPGLTFPLLASQLRACSLLPTTQARPPSEDPTPHPSLSQQHSGPGNRAQPWGRSLALPGWHITPGTVTITYQRLCPDPPTMGMVSPRMPPCSWPTPKVWQTHPPSGPQDLGSLRSPADWAGFLQMQAL